MANAKKTTLPEEQFRVLRSIYEWRFVGREVAAGNATGSLQSFERVPACFVHGEFHGIRIDVDKVLQFLELRELIKPPGPALHKSGAWILPSGRILNVENRPVESSPRGGLIHPGSRSWLFLDGELIKKSANARALDLTKEGLALVENAPQIQLPGESREALRKRAERYVRNNGFPGVNELARRLKCGASSLTNAIKVSQFLKARKAEYMAKGKKPRETALSDVVLDNEQQTTESEPLASLIEDQKADQKSDNRMPRRSRHRS